MKENKRKKTNAEMLKWDVGQVVERFRFKYKSNYGNDYTVGKVDYTHMKKLLTQLTVGNLQYDQIYLFFDYAFNRAKDMDYVLQVFGLKYHANEYLTNVVRNKTGV